MTEWVYRTENTAETVLANVLNPKSDDGEQCSGCEAIYNWDDRSDYCPYHQGVLDGHDKAFGDLSQAAIAFQADPELMNTVLDARSRQKVEEYRAMQRAEANQPAPTPEGFSDHEKQIRDASEWRFHPPEPEDPTAVRLAVDADCPACGYPERRFDPNSAVFSCRKCPYTSHSRDL